MTAFSNLPPKNAEATACRISSGVGWIFSFTSMSLSIAVAVEPAP